MGIGFRVLHDHEVEARSFGLVTVPSLRCSGRHQEAEQSLFDPRIFGFDKDFTCACGKLEGAAHAERICDMCGVRVGIARALRRSRFGHIALRRRIRHPLIHSVTIGVIPVIPIAYRADRDEGDLDFLYAEVLRANQVVRTEEYRDAAPSGEPDEGLDAAVASLIDNGARSSPLAHKGKILRSLRYYTCEDPSTELEDLGVYLFALMLAIVGNRPGSQSTRWIGEE